MNDIQIVWEPFESRRENTLAEGDGFPRISLDDPLYSLSGLKGEEVLSRSLITVKKWSRKWGNISSEVVQWQKVQNKAVDPSSLPLSRMSGYMEPEDAIMEDTFQEVTKPKRVLQVVIDDDHPFDLDAYIGTYSGIHSAPFYHYEAHI
jgi:hypothetical protein